MYKLCKSARIEALVAQAFGMTTDLVDILHDTVFEPLRATAVESSVPVICVQILNRAVPLQNNHCG